MNWQGFFLVWAAVSGASVFLGLIVVAFAVDTDNDVSLDKRWWLVPGGLALLTALFGSLAALITK